MNSWPFLLTPAFQLSTGVWSRYLANLYCISISPYTLKLDPSDFCMQTAPAGAGMGPRQTTQRQILTKSQPVHSNVSITLKFIGIGLHLGKYAMESSLSDVMVVQQHCGGNTVILYKGKVKPKGTHSNAILCLWAYLCHLVIFNTFSTSNYFHRDIYICVKATHWDALWPHHLSWWDDGLPCECLLWVQAPVWHAPG